MCSLRFFAQILNFCTGVNAVLVGIKVEKYENFLQSTKEANAKVKLIKSKTLAISSGTQLESIFSMHITLQWFRILSFPANYGNIFFACIKNYALENINEIF
jgi:ABC-type branched-subunit amino acid transport system substrate-binding protein